MLRQITITSVLWLLALPLHAQEIRLDSPGGTMEGLPVYSQIGGTCYAYSAALAIDAYRNSHSRLDQDELTNPFELALGNGQLEYGQVRLSPTVGGGMFCPVVSYAKRAGICTRGVFPTVNDQGENLRYVIKDITQYHTDYSALSCKDKDGAAGDIILEKVRTRLGDFEMPEDKIPDQEDLRSAAKKNLRNYQRLVLSDPWCEGAREKVELPCGCHQEASFLEPVSSIIRKIEERIASSESQPVSIAFCSELLDQGKGYRGFSHDFFDFKFPKLDECGGHVVLISGKRPHPISGRLEFLIHNSWGGSCSRYSPDWECEGGRIWVDAEELAENTYGLMWLGAK